MCAGETETEWGTFTPQNNRGNRLNGCLEDDNKHQLAFYSLIKIKSCDMILKNI